jgi:hypothetical protein
MLVSGGAVLACGFEGSKRQRQDLLADSSFTYKSTLRVGNNFQG